MASGVQCQIPSASVADDIDDLFDQDGNGELVDLENKENCEPEDDLDELAALFEEEERTAAESENNADSKDVSQMEDEYAKLQAQMEALKEKIQKKKPSGSSPPSSSSTDSKSEGKRTFLDAFSSALSQTTPEQPNSSVDKVKTKLNVSERLPPQPEPDSCSNPPQKKRRTSFYPQVKATNSVEGKSSAGFHNTKPTPKSGGRINQSRALSHKPNVEKIELEQYSRLRLKHRYVSSSEMQQRMQSKTYLKLGLIRPTLKLAEETDWVTVAVVAKQLDPQTAKNGKPFSIWHLTDLDDCTKHVAFFLFGRVHEELWRKITVGTVVGLLNPSIMPPKRDDSAGKNYDNTPALTVDVVERVMKIGVSADLGWCTATRYRNKQPAGKCLAFINKQFGESCVFHMQSKYKKISSKRGELQGSAAAPVADRYKKTLWKKVKGDQFFYGGQTFSAAPPSSNPNIQRKESKMKLTNIFGNVRQGLTPEQKEKLNKSKVMQAVGGIKPEQSVTGCSDSFAEMLSSGDMVAGSRQFLNHLQKKEKEKILEQEKKTPLSPVAVLQERKKLMQEKLKNSSKGNSPNPQSVCFISPDTIKKCTENLFNQRKKQNVNKTSSLLNKSPMLSKALSQSPAPQLSSNDSKNEGVDLFSSWISSKKVVKTNSTLTLAELRKKKAMAKLRSDSGGVEIKKSNPNRSMIGRVKDIKSSEKLKEKVKKKVELNRQDLEEHENDEEKEETTNVLGGSQMSEEEFKRILNATSSHSYELDIAEMKRQEEYFNPLIQKEMMEEKMADTYEMPAKVVTCQQCCYTFWAPHERCKQLHHSMQWKNVKKRFFECTNCKQRTVTWDPYPAKACRECGSARKWKRTCMLKSRDLKLDSEVLLIRGIEHSQFLNALR